MQTANQVAHRMFRCMTRIERLQFLRECLQNLLSEENGDDTYGPDYSLWQAANGVTEVIQSLIDNVDLT